MLPCQHLDSTGTSASADVTPVPSLQLLTPEPRGLEKESRQSPNKEPVVHMYRPGNMQHGKACISNELKIYLYICGLFEAQSGETQKIIFIFHQPPKTWNHRRHNQGYCTLGIHLLCSVK